MKARSLFILLAMVCFAVFLSGESDASLPYSCATGDCVFGISSPNPLCEVQTKTEGQVADDPSHNYPYGLIEFVVGDAGCQVVEGSLPTGITPKFVFTTDVQMCFFRDELHLPPLDMAEYTYRKYGPTPDNPVPHWYDFMYNGQTGAVIAGNCITLYFVDGERGDDDLTQNGFIVDQGGPGQGNLSVPAVTPSGMGFVVLLMGLTALFSLRRLLKTRK